ncbi:DUF6252 family protein [Flavobacterium reichenbachii]|uniref:Lipid/polyisoprenoid-binding YceI-like domain-containing protein n=1 Tax=Flavobacterium reichenbachii TaxID=362418 RepID=A0A085ZRW2_9FLAO|nr:DUF6252 family protein [Flavobacterium reichenbachii]KFF07176.1 hypothetical protein IW19_17420 [Flavobacterium reichenbachii]OXB13330.1 hypothetical protein B0A68_16370 [Flavobacterium reichenbachii]
MKKYMFLLALMLVFFSCSEDVKFNNPAFQGVKDNVFWRAQVYTASMSTNGNLIIQGSLGLEKVTLTIASPALQTNMLGVDDVSKASYINEYAAKAITFSTGKNIGNGQVTVTEFNAEAKTISGTFKFTALNLNESDTENSKVNFTEGVFYKVPISTVIEY